MTLSNSDGRLTRGWPAPVLRLTPPQPGAGSARQGEFQVFQETVIAAGRGAHDCIDTLRSLQALPNLDFRVESPLAHLVAFCASYSAVVQDRWAAPIRRGYSLLRGLRGPEGVHLAGRQAGCAHEVVVDAVSDLQRWLESHQSLSQPALILTNTCLDLLDALWWEWKCAVKRLICAKLAPEQFRELATDKRWAHPKWAKTNQLYKRLVEEPRFQGMSFVEAVNRHGPPAYISLAQELGQRAGAIDTDQLRQAVRWETSRYMLSRGGALAEEPIKPHWDGKRLWYGDRIVHEFSSLAGPQIELLEAFQRAGWRANIADPFNDNERQRQVIKNLNNGRVGRILTFKRDGSGEGVEWSLA